MPQLQKGGPCRNFAYYSMLNILSWRPKRGPRPNGGPWPRKRNQSAIQCDMCGGWIHLKCTVISPLKFHTLCSTEPYLCQNCYSELFPFQTLDDKQLLNEMRNDEKLNFDINHTNNSFFPPKCLQVDNKIKSLLNDLNSGLVDSKYCSQAEANIINKKCKIFFALREYKKLKCKF